MATLRIEINKAVLDWALQRTGLTEELLLKEFPKLNDWRQGKEHPTLKQAKSLAKKAHIPFGRLLLDEPTGEGTDVPDFRTVGNQRIDGMSPDLQEVIRSAEGRLAWYAEYATEVGIPGPSILRLTQEKVTPSAAAHQTRLVLEFGADSPVPGRDKVGALVNRMEESGMLVSRNSIVGNSTSRPLDVDEFRGFTLINGAYCLVFINTRDAKTAQLFSLAHELAHVALGEAGVSNHSEHHRVERWCNSFAAAFLAPEASIKQRYVAGKPLLDNIESLAAEFGMSREAVLWRLREVDLIDAEAASKVLALVRASTEARTPKVSSTGGPAFHVLVRSRVGGRFYETVTMAAQSGEIAERDAARYLGAASYESLEKLIQKSAWANQEVV
ncbi:ImmA/IrrE family metallo-endopeptidase [Corynebacterium imitans]|uniref:ImmA/IrrE family metallo-endopeptidase n=1 Tax=Corynebacterium imitans TaxID=156978 RepID=UPI001EF3958B|nr:ImmA/IrrE family metallo-endopeptidase [Corynebacterium imitans]MCG7278184.1 ImmA/IrrE family metallo-endopeptidase [Corynebacterium imitans]